MEEYPFHLQSWLQVQQGRLEKIKGLNSPVFNKLSFHCTDINEESLRLWAEHLQEAGIRKETSVLYYFEIEEPFDAKVIRDKVNGMKLSSGKSPLRLPKVNKQTTGDESNVLYVGKTNSNFIIRFKQHLGLKPNSTYALQLSGWATSLNIQITLNYAVYCLPQEELDLLEQVEHVLHFAMKPILGRSGH
jgi:hypothetical protein